MNECAARRVAEVSVDGGAAGNRRARRKSRNAAARDHPALSGNA
jgi:hypothetical protein